MKEIGYVTPEMEIMEIESDICTTIVSNGTSTEAGILEETTDIGSANWD